MHFDNTRHAERTLVQALSIYWKKRPVELGKNGKLVRGPSAQPRDAPKAVADRNALDDILATVKCDGELRISGKKERERAAGKVYRVLEGRRHRSDR
jgi:hypothetical protein